jgi:prevent-host-death family protein
MTIQANIHQAKSNLSRLIEAAELGEEVIISRDGKPAVRLVAIPKLARTLGQFTAIACSPDWDSAASNAEIAEALGQTDRHGLLD